jgi:hypothetical protein
MTTFDPATGLLTASRETIAALVTIATGGDADPALVNAAAADPALVNAAAADRAAADAAVVDAAAVDAALSAAGAGTLADPHPRLADALAPLRRPRIGITVGKSGFVAPGWVGDGRFTFHAYRGGHDDQLVSMPAGHLVHFLLWLFQIGPRPREPRPAETVVDGDALNRAMALRLGGRPADGLLPEPLGGAIARGFRDWWMPMSRWVPAPGAPGSVALEAVDTDAGLWAIERREDGTAIVRPVRPMTALLELGDLLPNDDLIDADARLPPELTPRLGGPVAWVADVLAG